MTPSAAAQKRPSDVAGEAAGEAETTPAREDDCPTTAGSPPGTRPPRTRRTGIDLFALLYPDAFGPEYAAEPGPPETCPPGAAESRHLPAGGPAALESPEAPAAPLRIAARALVAIMVCDGVLHPQERAFVDDLLVRRGQEPLARHEIRPWRPAELPVPENPEDVLEALAALAHIDGERDPSEWRLVTEFASAWRVSPGFLERLDRSLAPSPQGAFQRLLAVTRRWIEIPAERRR